MGKKYSILKLWKLSDKKYMFLLQVIMKVILSLSAIYVSQLARSIVDDDVFMNSPLKIAEEFAFVMIIGTIASFTFSYAKSAYSVRLSYRLKNIGMDKLTRCKYEYLEKGHSGALINRMIHDINAVAEYISEGFPEFFGSMISFVCCFVYLLFVNWQMVMTCAICIPITIYFTKKLATNTYKTMENFEAKLDETCAMAKDSVLNHKSEKAYNLKEIRRKEFDATMDEATAHYVEYERLVAKASPVRYLLNSAPTFICILVGFINAYVGQITSGEFVSVILLLENISKPLSEFIGYVTDYKMAQVSMDRVMEVFEYPEEESGEYKGEDNEEIFCYDIKNLTFGYDDNNILDDFELKVNSGKMVAIVGESGSGKSTLFKLLAGFYPAKSGSLKMYNHEIREWDLKALRERIAYVEQTPYLFNGSIKENIRAGRINACDEDIVKAAKMAYAHEFIMELPNGYDTEISEGGKSLSGGQRQRIAIARAFVKNAPILLLDEMTSALDNESEKLIQQAIENYRKGRSIFIVAHRLSTIVGADQILVMNKGKIVESGTHKELLEKGGIYNRLYSNVEGGEA